MHEFFGWFQDDEEAYAADTDSDTDEERPIAVAAMATVLYSSEDEQEPPRRPQVSSKSRRTNIKLCNWVNATGHFLVTLYLHVCFKMSPCV